jgi:hypothetical protein
MEPPWGSNAVVRLEPHPPICKWGYAVDERKRSGRRIAAFVAWWHGVLVDVGAVAERQHGMLPSVDPGQRVTGCASLELRYVEWGTAAICIRGGNCEQVVSRSVGSN